MAGARNEEEWGTLRTRKPCASTRGREEKGGGGGKVSTRLAHLENLPFPSLFSGYHARSALSG